MLDCLKCLKKIDFKKTGIFAAGVYSVQQA